MIGTEFLQGQGLGNRLFCYVTARCAALDHGAVFGTAGQEYLQADFLDLDLGEKIPDPAGFARYDEAEERLYIATSAHDMVHGIFIAGADPGVLHVQDNTLLYGNLQAQEYFLHHKNEIHDWLRVRPEFDSNEYTADDLCILNVRGGEYADNAVLFLRRKYWLDAMRHMRSENPAMRFMIVTDDVENARKLLPEIPAYHFTPDKDYVTVRNARYLIISNSSFAFFPAFTSDTVRRVIAPKYWARHNVSDGYWASAQNIYDGFEYLDREGKLWTAQECRSQLQSYHLPETSPWAADDAAVEKVRKRNDRKVLIRKAAMKMYRMSKRLSV